MYVGRFLLDLRDWLTDLIKVWNGDINVLTKLIASRHRCAREKFRLTFSLSAAPEIHYFVGRVGNLSSIGSALLPSTTERRIILVLHGLGGIGKSQLAIEYAKRHRHHYSAVLWLNAKTEESLKQGFAAYARLLPKDSCSQELLYGPQNGATLTEITQRMNEWLSLPENNQWLVIYDNVDNPKIPDNKSANAYDLGLYFPKAYQGSIIVTTRWKTLSIGPLQEVAKLSQIEESVSLLEQMTGRLGLLKGIFGDKSKLQIICL